jgi:glycerol-3-phosphate acyltransferase PlsY
LNVGTPVAEILAGLLAFLIGAVPFGWIYGRVICGVDLRKVGSGNVGATNAARLYRGKKAILVFVFVFLLDFAKGFAAAMLSPGLGNWLGRGVSDETMGVICGAAAILGHVFTPYLNFRGGKGVATALGVVSGLATWPAVYAVGFWGVLVAITRYVSLGSMVAVLSIPITYWLKWKSDTFHGRLGIFAFLTAIAVVVVWRHRENLRRLLRGQENRIGEDAGRRSPA